MNRLKGIPIFEVTKPGKMNIKRQKARDALPNIEQLPTRELVQMYLCDKGKSRCVRTGRCICLNKCRYGQEYVKRRRESVDGTKVWSDD